MFFQAYNEKVHNMYKTIIEGTLIKSHDNLLDNILNILHVYLLLQA